MAKGSADDPKGLILEAYRIDGIGKPECRSIFLDWALSLPDGQDPQAAITRLLETHGHGAEEHPMSAVLREGLSRLSAPRRRGGWRSRPRGPA
ncbi:MAG: hypothetical protein AAFY38_01605 [Pseudomonadota bacterium]